MPWNCRVQGSYSQGFVRMKTFMKRVLHISLDAQILQDVSALGFGGTVAVQWVCQMQS